MLRIEIGAFIDSFRQKPRETMGSCPPPDSCPAALVTRDQWVGWRTQERDGKQTKVPVDPATNQFASTTDPETWTDFATAREHATANDLGIGFVFTADDPIVGVDLDDCRDPEDGTLTEWAEDIVTRLDSFTEVSPSGSGLHVLVKGDLPDGRNRHGDVELYDDARFFTVTGEHMSGTPTTIEARQDALQAVHTEYVAQDDPSNRGAEDGTTSEGTATAAAPDRTNSGTATGPGNDLGDDALLKKARNASNGEKFQRLWRGTTTGYPSQSEADMALCSMLAFWTGGDADQMDRLFRDSGLMRSKWDEQHFADGATYGERTIERAIHGTDEFFTRGETRAAAQAAATTENGAASMADHDATGAEATEATGETMVPKSAVEELNAELQRLQAENETLREELVAERERRQELEAAGMDSSEDTGGVLSTLLSWVS